MSSAIPEKYHDLFSKRAFASLGTLMPDGRPQVTPVWCDLEGELVVFNSAKGRQKDRNVRRDPRVAIAIIDPDNPYRHLEVRGRVVEITEQGAVTVVKRDPRTQSYHKVVADRGKVRIRHRRVPRGLKSDDSGRAEHIASKLA